jgi:hypothetical protein
MRTGKPWRPVDRVRAAAVKIYLEGLDAAVASRHGYTVVNRVEDADVCVVKIVPGRRAGAAGRGARTGRGRRGQGRGIGGLDTGGEPIVLTLADELLSAVRATMRLKPTVLAIHLDACRGDARELQNVIELAVIHDRPYACARSSRTSTCARRF